MSRDDSLLYTGQTSASFSHEDPIRQAIREQKKEIRGQLKPAAVVVFAEIKAEMEKVMNITQIDISGAKDEKTFMIEMMARQKYVAYLKQLQNKLDNILREPRKAKQTEASDE